MYELKNDKYRRARGGKAVFIDILCAKCNGLVMVYQKDGEGKLKRCYLNRIFFPLELERLQYSPAVKTTKDFSALFCKTCKQLIGSPMLHHEGRLAFRLFPGSYFKTRHSPED